MTIKLQFEVRRVEAHERPQVANFLEAHWGSVQIVSRGHIHQADCLPAFVAIWDEQVVGLVTYHIHQGMCEIVSLDSLIVKIGVGTALINAVIDEATRYNCKRAWLITTNDNEPAIRFYERQGMTLVAIHQNALHESRKLKPEIPHTGLGGKPLRDETEFEFRL